MAKKKEKLKSDSVTKLGIAIGILIISFSIFYYLVIFLPQKEQTRLSNEGAAKAEVKKEQETAKLDAAMQKLADKQLLDACLSDVSASYVASWKSNCEGKVQRDIKGYNNCVTGIGLSESYCRNLWGTPDSSPTCDLPAGIANDIEKSTKELKDECFKKYPQ